MTHLPKPDPRTRNMGSDITVLILCLGVASLALGMAMLAIPARPKPEAAKAPESAQQAIHESDILEARAKAEQVQSEAPSVKPETGTKAAAYAPNVPTFAKIDPDAGTKRARVEPVKVLTQVRPSYPPVARAARVQGEVEVRMLVDSRGIPIRASVLSGPPALREQALQAAEAWRFAPARRNGQPVNAPYTVRFDFRLA